MSWQGALQAGRVAPAWLPVCPRCALPRSSAA
jgi:hypothetical protein